MTNAFGFQPTRKDLTLTKGADFTQTLTATLPANTDVWIELYDSSGTTLDTWDATVDADSADFLVQSVDADEIPARSTYRLYVRYDTSPSTTEHCWYYGTVKRTPA